MKLTPRGGLTALAAVALLFTSACAAASDSDSSGVAPGHKTSLTQCKPATLPLVKSGTLTIATDDPAYDPWFSDNNPSNGKGFESAVAYAVADKLGFPKAKVTWVKQGFNQAIQPGKKNFDFDINQFSISAKRAKAVDFSYEYYTVAQAIITLKSSKFAGATSMADLKDAKLGAQIATTSLDAIDQIEPKTKPLVYDDTSKAGQALANKQVDAIVADLPTAYYLTAAEIDNSKIVGQFDAAPYKPETFGLLLGKNSGLTPCASLAVAALHKDGTLKKLEDKWLSQATSVPELY